MAKMFKKDSKTVMMAALALVLGSAGFAVADSYPSYHFNSPDGAPMQGDGWDCVAAVTKGGQCRVCSHAATPAAAKEQLFAFQSRWDYNYYAGAGGIQSSIMVVADSGIACSVFTGKNVVGFEPNCNLQKPLDQLNEALAKKKLMQEELAKVKDFKAGIQQPMSDASAKLDAALKDVETSLKGKGSSYFEPYYPAGADCKKKAAVIKAEVDYAKNVVSWLGQSLDQYRVSAIAQANGRGNKMEVISVVSDYTQETLSEQCRGTSGFDDGGSCELDHLDSNAQAK